MGPWGRMLQNWFLNPWNIPLRLQSQDRLFQSIHCISQKSGFQLPGSILGTWILWVQGLTVHLISLLCGEWALQAHRMSDGVSFWISSSSTSTGVVIRLLSSKYDWRFLTGFDWQLFWIHLRYQGISVCIKVWCQRMIQKRRRVASPPPFYSTE